jgi:hypothetical protein
VVTIATDLDNAFLVRLLIPSCASVGLELTVLHAAVPAASAFTPSDKRAIMTGFLGKLRDRDELIMFTDAYDALFVRGEAHIQSAYSAFGERIVFSAEPNSWPLGAIGYALHADPPAGSYPYLNSGGYIGPAGDLLELCTRYPVPPSERFEVLARLSAHRYNPDKRFGWSDQYYWTLIQHLEHRTVALDHDATLFECFTAPNPDISVREMMRDVQEFRAHGTDTPLYQQEYERLKGRLDTPSAAAHVHFANAVTKAAALELFDQGLLPDWLAAVLDPAAAATTEHVRIIEI